MTTNEFVNLVESLIDKKVQKPFKLGKIDSNYTSGLPKVLFDGETTVSNKQYSYASNYTPVANQRVLLVSIADTYIILCGIINV